MSDLSLYALGLVTGGLWADPGGAAAVGLEVRGEPPEDVWTPAAAFALELRVAFPGRVVASEPLDVSKPASSESFTLAQYTAAVVPCARWKYVFGCGVIQSGFYFIDDARIASQGQPSLALGPRLGARLPIGERFALFGFGEALFAPVRAGFVPFGGNNVWWRPSVAQGYGAVGIEVIFP